MNTYILKADVEIAAMDEDDAYQILEEYFHKLQKFTPDFVYLSKISGDIKLEKVSMVEDEDCDYSDDCYN